jgi:myo-inositol-1(or 4)-monophosphatase
MPKYSNIWTDRLIVAVKTAQSQIIDLIGTSQGKKQYGVGAGGDITVELDRIAEETIIKSIQSYNTPCYIISEEIGYFYWDHETKTRIFDFAFLNLDCKSYFIIDPVDGSTNAKRGIPFSCISIAYSNGLDINDIQIGVVSNITTGDLYVAEKGFGAFLNHEPIQCSPINSISNAIAGTDVKSSSACNDFLDIHNNILFDIHKLRILGSCALELCLVAQGALDLYLDLRGIVRIVDIAAGILIVREAGGFCIGQFGTNLVSNGFLLKDRYVIIAGCPGIEDEILVRVKKL